MEQIALTDAGPAEISVCIITKNAGGMLDRLLDSLEGHVDELIIGVDRKSTDQTLAVAQKRATVCYEFDFQDFPQARNECISRATKPYVLIMDDDEYFLKGQGVELLRNVCGMLEKFETEIGAVNLWIREVERESGTMWQQPRLFRRSMNPYYEKVPHNRPVISGKVTNINCFGFQLIVVHAKSEERIFADRDRRKEYTTKRLEDRLKTDPNDMDAIFYLSRQLVNDAAHGRSMDRPDWKQSGERADQLLQQYIGGLNGDYTNKAFHRWVAAANQLTLNNESKALDYYWQSLRDCPDFPESWCALGKHYYEKVHFPGEEGFGTPEDIRNRNLSKFLFMVAHMLEGIDPVATTGFVSAKSRTYYPAYHLCYLYLADQNYMAAVMTWLSAYKYWEFMKLDLAQKYLDQFMTVGKQLQELLPELDLPAESASALESSVDQLVQELEAAEVHGHP